ncbi:MAG: caspase family protein, partial [Deltaproteobacteria bacterium]|nr:caspase family protein [Deltaproteobacteria bacterium]
MTGSPPGSPRPCGVMTLAATLLACAMAALVGRPAGAGEIARFAVLAAHPDGGPGTQRLRWAERDAHKVRDVLVELGGFREEDARLLVAPDGPALLAALEQADRLARKAAATAGNQALLLFYYSGHASGGELRLGRTRLPMAELRRLLLREAPGTIRIALLDACESGAITRLKGGRRAASFVFDIEPDPGSTGSIVITSSSESEASQESEELRGSFFTHYLVSGLRGAADRTADGQITLAEAYEHAYHQTVAHTAGTRGGTQHPTYTYDLQGKGAIVLTRLAGLGALLFPEQAAGEFLVYDLERDLVVGEVAKAAGSLRRLSVPPGRYAIKKREPDHLLLQLLQVAAGESRQVEPGAFVVVPFEEDVTKGPGFLEQLRGERRSFALTARLGAQSFFDAPVRSSLFPASGLLGLRLEAANLLARRLSLHLDAALGQREEELRLEDSPYAEQHRVDFRLLVAGAWLSWDLALQPLLLRLGPRLSGVYARREFLGRDAALPFQDLFTFSPGLEAGLSFDAGPLRLGAEGRVHYLRY